MVNEASEAALLYWTPACTPQLEGDICMRDNTPLDIISGGGDKSREYVGRRRSDLDLRSIYSEESFL